MNIYNIFDAIVQSSVGNGGNAGPVLLQLYISLFFEVKFLFSSMKNKPDLVKVVVSMIPLVFIATYSIACGIIFGSFLGNGPNAVEMIELVQLTLSKTCVSEMMIVVAMFFVLTIIYSVAYRMNPLQWLLTFSVELLAALALLVLYGGLLVENFPFTIFDLCSIDLFLAKWPIYGYFTLMFKCCVLVISLFLGLLLHERKPKPVSEEEMYLDRGAYCEKKVLKYLTKNDMTIGSSLLIFSAVSICFFVFAFSRDKEPVIIWEFLFSMLILVFLYLFIIVVGFSLVYRALRPQTTKVYRQLVAAGDKDTMLRLFCEEIVDATTTETILQFNDFETRTKHFVLRRRGSKTWLDRINPIA